MTQDFIVRDQAVIQATPVQVWHALTTPELTKKYFFKSEVHSDWQAGSRLFFTRKILGIPLSLKGRIEKIEPEKLLQYKLINAHLFGKPDLTKFSLVMIKLSFADGKTTVSVADDVGSYAGAQKRYDKSVKGWHTILTGLKKLLESK